MPYPAALTSKIPKQLIETSNTYLELIPSEIAEHYIPKKLPYYDALDESVANFAAKFHRLEKHCNSGSSLDEMIWDHIVCGIQDEGTEIALAI